MSSEIFKEGMPHDLIDPMYEDGYAIKDGLVDPEFATNLLAELKEHRKFTLGTAAEGREPGVTHDREILDSLCGMPLLEEYLNELNDAITDISGFDHEHLTYLTVRACPVDRMSSHIHRNDDVAGPWLVSLVVEGSGSFNVYGDHVIDQGYELALTGNTTDPVPIASSDMSTGDAWGIYSRDWSPPHAGGLNTSIDPKVLVMLYGWLDRENYPYKGTSPDDWD